MSFFCTLKEIESLFFSDYLHEVKQGVHRSWKSWKSWKCPGILFFLEFVLEILEKHPFLANVLEMSWNFINFLSYFFC